ncbi:MAG: acyl-CoA thioesterase [Paracoccaceae bacterium]
MYPFVRMAKALWQARRQPPLGLLDSHVSEHICWPWDLDLWVELNNGRTLTLFDLGRVPLGVRTGLSTHLVRQRWGLTVAGSSVRYRRRIRAFERFTMYSRCIGWDARFIYMEQSMWKGGECANNLLIRSAVTSAKGIVPPAEVLKVLGHEGESPAFAPWVQAWIDAEAQRPWPPAK